MLLGRRTTVLGLSALASLAAVHADAATQSEVLAAAVAQLRRFSEATQWEGVRNLIGAARAVLLAPELNSGGFLITGTFGPAIVIARHGNVWTDPVFVNLRGASVGLQAGVQTVALTTVVLSASAMKRLISGGLTAGGSGGFSLGDIGVRGGTGGGVDGGVETITVATSKGLFVGGGFDGTQLTLDADANKAAYGAKFKPDELLARPQARLAGASILRQVLAEMTRTSFGQG